MKCMGKSVTFVYCCILIHTVVIISYFETTTCKFGALLNRLYESDTSKMGNYSEELFYRAKYLQENILDNLVLESKKEFNEKFVQENAAMNRSKFNTGFSTLTSHNCPIIRPNYLCSDLHDNRFENYTISLEYDNDKYVSSSNYNQYFSSNIENKFMQRLFNNGTLFNTNKDMTIVLWGNSYIRQMIESFSCVLHQFDFTPLKMWKYSSDKNKLIYKHNGYINKNNYSADIRISTTSSFNQTSPYFQPCLGTQEIWNESIFERFNVSNMESWINNHTDWDKVYGEYYLNQLKNGQNVNMVKEFFANLSESDLKHLAAGNMDDDKLFHQISTNMVDMYHTCGDDYTYIGLFNNKTQKRNDFFLIVTNGDVKNHSLIDSLKRLNINDIRKQDNLNFTQFVNHIDLIILNVGNHYVKNDTVITKYNLDKLPAEYKQLQYIRSQQDNYNNIPIIITTPWLRNDLKSKKWNKLAKDFINKYKLPIVHYSLWDVIQRSSMTDEQLKKQRALGGHYCIPGPPIKFAFTYFEMIEMLTLHMQL